MAGEGTRFGLGVGKVRRVSGVPDCVVYAAHLIRRIRCTRRGHWAPCACAKAHTCHRCGLIFAREAD